MIYPPRGDIIQHQDLLDRLGRCADIVGGTQICLLRRSEHSVRSPCLYAAEGSLRSRSDTFLLSDVQLDARRRLHSTTLTFHCVLCVLAT